MKKDELLKIWNRYDAELRKFDEELQWKTYTPYKRIHAQDEFIHSYLEEEKLFFLPKKFVYFQPHELAAPVKPPQIATPPKEPNVSQLLIDPDRENFSYRIGKKVGDIVSSAIGSSASSNEKENNKVFTPTFVDEIREYAREVSKNREKIIEKFNDNFNQELKNHKEINSGIESPTIEANIRLLEKINYDYYLPNFLLLNSNFFIDIDRKILLINFEFPNYHKTIFDKDEIKRHGRATATQIKKLIKKCLYSMMIRYAYLGARYRIGDFYESVAVNAEQNWIDGATGKPRNGIIASLFAKCEELDELNLAQLDPDVCFKHLKGISIQALEKPTAIRPIFVLNKDDDRIVDSKDLNENLLENSNLAAMDWEDFEHLVAQLFEWEFAKDGVEVKVTRASRDRGVDAILFDPNPLRGGKYVLQAKRYTQTVDVSAVRDLYGTVMNEGANRGILITTAGFGPDAYEFAKDKPISLVDGQNLLVMLQKHGKKFRIDLEEARLHAQNK
jgi:restriction system protein